MMRSHREFFTAASKSLLMACLLRAPVMPRRAYTPCTETFLQIPSFFAFYRSLSSSIRSSQCIVTSSMTTCFDISDTRTTSGLRVVPVILSCFPRSTLLWRSCAFSMIKWAKTTLLFFYFISHFLNRFSSKSTHLFFLDPDPIFILFPHNEVLYATSKLQPSYPDGEPELVLLSLITIVGDEMSIICFKSNSATEAEAFKLGKLSQKSPSWLYGLTPPNFCCLQSDPQ